MIASHFNRLYNKPYLLLFLAILFWAGNFVVGRAIIDLIPPITLSFIRWLLASLMLLPFAWPYLKKDWPEIKKRIPYYFLLGLLSGAAYNALTYLGFHTTTANNAFVINAALPIFIILANFVLNGIELTFKETLAIALSLFGVLLIITKGDLSTLAELSFTIGDILVFIAVLCWALYTALLKTRPKLHSFSFAVITFATATIILIPFTIIEMSLGHWPEISLNSAITILYISIFPALLAYVFYNRGVELIGGNKAGVMLYLMTPLGAVLSFLFLGEIPEIYHYIGFVLIITGVLISANAKTKNAAPQK